MLKKMVSLIAILFLVNLFQSVMPIIGESKTCSLLNGPSIRAFNEYVYGSHFNLSGYTDEVLRSHFFTIIGEDLSEKELHNFTATIETDESINNIRSSPNCQVLNRSLDHKHFMNAIFNGTSFNFEVRFNPNKERLDPINLSIEPSDTDFFSLDLQNNLRFGIWLNVSRLLSSTWLKVSSFSQPSANIQKFSVITELKIGMKDTRRNEIGLQLVELPIGNHYMQFEINYEGGEGNFYVSVSAREQDNLFLPSSCYLDGNEVSVERTLLFRYSSYTIKFLKGVSPWIYGYRSPEFYSLNYLSPKQCMLKIDENSREQIEYLLLNAEIERVSFEETNIHGNPTYQIVLELNSNSTVEFGLMLYEKTWFLQPGRMKLNDIPSYIINKYTDSSSLFDGEYIDVNNSLVQLWAEQVVGNETNPYYIAYLLFQNLTETLKYDDSLTDFNYDSEFASATLIRRSGVCRHFAVAYAALCMDVKLPVRTVTGTAFGSLNDTRKKNHKWNEVYFPGHGWVAIDVTWKRFGVLSNAHSIYTHWQGYSDTLEVKSMNQSRRLALKGETKKVLYTILNISKERLCNATRREESITQFNFEIDKAEELLSQLPSLIESGDVHQSLVVMSEANLIINRLEIVQPSMPIDIISFLVPFLIGVVFAIILLKFAGRIRVNADKQKKTKKIASQTGYLIQVAIITKPLTRFLKYIPIPAFTGLYVCGHHFEISVFVENLGSQQFLGGDLNILVEYAFGNLREVMTVTVPAISGGEKRRIDLKGRDRWGVLAQGHALFLAKLIDSSGKVVPLYDREGRPLQVQQRGRTHIHSFYSLSRGELYTLIALFMSVLALCIDIFLKSVKYSP